MYANPFAEPVRRLYEKPTMRKLTPEQVKLVLLGHASTGSEDAKDMLEVIYPELESPKG